MDYPPLTEAALSVWGKTDRKGSSLAGWLPLWRHLDDTTAIAERLWDQWLSPAVAHRIGSELPGGPEDGRVLLAWLAGLHDIGKATPAFACQSKVFGGRMRDRGLDYRDDVMRDIRTLAPHATAGHVLLADWLTQAHGWPSPDSFAVVVGGHHGVPPTDSSLRRARVHAEAFGGEAWQAVQLEFLSWMTGRTGAQERLPEWAAVTLSQPSQAVLTGLVVMADWIASNEEYFPYDFVGTARVGAAWQQLDLPLPWQAQAPPSADALFAARFDLPAGSTPRPVQTTVAERAAAMPLPGLMIVEAPMGEGKTEAALAAVEIIASRTGANGCFFALPTRATSDAMFRRILGWLQRLPDAEPGRGGRDVNLAHGKAAFNDDFAMLKRSTLLPSSIGVDEGGTGIGVHRWLAGRKRSLLSGFVIGTIDQLLFASLRARHLVLRHLGLAGKIVVVDEAHAYDVFMSTFLDMTLEWLGAHGVPVVILSATLPAQRRAAMMTAYDRGRLGPLTYRDRGQNSTDIATDQRYPLVTTSAAGRGGDATACANSGRSISVRMQRLAEDPAALEALLRDQLADGGCALIVHNTVARVQQTAACLRTVLGDDFPVSVAHSRFMAPDRSAKDKWLRDTFGPDGKRRPARHIVVASQVAEQSLDIDFDLLITDLAPVDLVLQRVGRLHRHDRVRPERLSEPVCYVTGADWTADPPVPVRGSTMIYHPSTLLRSVAVLLPYLSGGQPLQLPADISPLTQSAYSGAIPGPAAWHSTISAADMHAAEVKVDKERRATNFRLAPVGGRESTLIGWLDGGINQSDEERAAGHVRDDDSPALDVIMLVRTEDGLTIPPWTRGGGQAVPTHVSPGQLSSTVARCTISLPRTMTDNAVIDSVIRSLELANDVRAWAGDPWLDGELILEINADGRASIAGFDLHYEPHDGLHVSKSD